jgi:hypothetical protein
MSNMPFDTKDMARRRKRSIVMAVILAVLIVLFFAITIVRLSGNAATMAGS